MQKLHTITKPLANILQYHTCKNFGIDLANLTASMENGMSTFGMYTRRNCDLLAYS